MISLNIQGLRLEKDFTKNVQLSDKSTIENALIVALTETWLKPDILDAEIDLKGFNTFRADRSERSRGGACLFVRNDLSAVPILSYSNDVVEVVGAKVRELEALVFSVYRPPDTQRSEWRDGLEKISEAIRFGQAHSDKFSRIFIMGDLNMPTCRWNSEGGLESNHRDSQEADLKDFFQENYLIQTVLKPTRLNNILDIVMTNDRSLVSHNKVELNRKLSDHNTITTYITIGPKKLKPSGIVDLHETKIPLYNLTRADDEDWLRMEAKLDSLNWGEMSCDLAVEGKIKLLNNKLEEAVNENWKITRK